MTQHGALVYCDTCDAKGRWDDMSHADEPKKAEFDNAVWYNNYTKSIECAECYLK